MRNTKPFRAVAVLIVAFFASAWLAQAAELVNTPNVPTAWRFEALGGSAATMQLDQDALRFDIKTRGEQNWSIQVYQEDKKVRNGAVCTLQFTAKADHDRPLGINSQLAQPPWTPALKTTPTVNLTQQWHTYTLQLAFQNTNNAPLRIPVFILGDATGTVWIKDVSVTDRAGAVTPPASAPTARRQRSGSVATRVAPGDDLLAAPMDPASWKFETADSGRGTLKLENGALRIDVEAPGREPWHVQMFQLPRSLAANRPYVLTVSLRATEARKVIFVAQQNSAPNEMLLPHTVLSVGPEWKQYKLRFTLKKAAPAQTRVPLLQMGDTAGTVFIRAMSLTEAPDTPLQPQ